MSKFLSYEDRMVIAQRLQENASFGAIGKELGKDRTTIAKEIKKYSYEKKIGRPGYPYNPCKFRTTCKAKKLCGTNCTHPSAYNAAYALSARFTVLILQKIFALLKRSHPMFVMDAVSSQNVRG